MNQHALSQIMDGISKDRPHSTTMCNVAIRAFNVGFRLDELRESVAKDNKLTDIGKREKIAEAAKGFIREALDVARPQRTAMAQVIGQRMNMKPKPLDPTDAVGELRRQELRAFIRKTPVGQRLTVAEQLALDGDSLEAIVSAPAPLSGLPPDQYEHVSNLYRRKHFGEQLDRLEGVEEDCQAAGAAIDMLMTSLRQSMGLNPAAFDTLVEKTKAEIDAR